MCNVLRDMELWTWSTPAAHGGRSRRVGDDRLRAGGRGRGGMKEVANLELLGFIV
jgi:hypothetical protein